MTILFIFQQVHHKLKVPIVVSDTTKCSFSEKSGVAEMIKKASLFLIDEFTMGHKHMYETIDRSFKDLLGNDLPFGGKVVVFGGDWKQCLPIVPNGYRPDIVMACLKSSVIWDHMKILTLTRNMRAVEDQEFADFVLEVGLGTRETFPNIGEDMIKIPEPMQSKATNLNELVDEIYPNLDEKIKNAKKNMEDPRWNNFVHERTIICPTNADVEEINRLCIEKLSSPPIVCYSGDRYVNDGDSVKFPPEFLNKISLPGLPPHVMVLKEGMPISLMRNMDPEHGHVNGAQ